MSSNIIKQKLDTVKDKSGKTLNDHLSNILTKLLLDNPKNVYDVFEDYATQIKLSQYDFKKHDELVDNSSRIRETYAQQKDLNEIAFKRLQQLNDGAEEPQDITSVNYVPNLLEEARQFEWAGIGFGEQQTYRLQKSLTELVQQKALKQVRLWGKIMGTTKDYYVVQSLGDSQATEFPPDVEPEGQNGINKYLYWVSNSVFGEWVQLPWVRPEQLRTSRHIKHIFTGILDTPIITNPHFKGKEADLLQCQIVRISFTTTIVPKGVFVVNADDKRVVEDPPEEEKQPIDFNNQTNLANWVHHTENILNEGRLTHMMPDPMPEGKEEADVKQELEEKDKFDVRLKPLSSDAAPSGHLTAWTLKKFYDETQYLSYSDEKQPAFYTNSVIVIQNLHWPGSVNIYYNGKQQSIYVGYGLQNDNTLFFPRFPQRVFEELPEPKDQPEPTNPPPEKVDPNAQN